MHNASLFWLILYMEFLDKMQARGIKVSPYGAELGLIRPTLTFGSAACLHMSLQCKLYRKFMSGVQVPPPTLHSTLFKDLVLAVREGRGSLGTCLHLDLRWQIHYREASVWTSAVSRSFMPCFIFITADIPEDVLHVWTVWKCCYQNVFAVVEFYICAFMSGTILCCICASGKAVSYFFSVVSFLDVFQIRSPWMKQYSCGEVVPGGEKHPGFPRISARADKLWIWGVNFLCGEGLPGSMMLSLADWASSLAP